MVAPTRTTTPMQGRVPNPVVQRMGIGPVRFSFTDAMEMVANGILPEDSTIELLDGDLVYRNRFDLREEQIVQGTKHNYVVNKLAQLLVQINSPLRHLRSQSTLLCAETHAPIPDATVIRGILDDYSDRLPTAEDALCVIEVADASYERDAGEKLTAYARAGVAQYIIINLRNRTAEVYITPDVAAGTYAPPQIIAVDGELPLRVGENEFLPIPLCDVLP